MFKILFIATVGIIASSIYVHGVPQVVVQRTMVYGQSSLSGPRPVSCGQNEVYLPQGVAPNCDSVCTELGKPCDRYYFQAPFGCYCLPDHARDANYACVHMSQCPINCTAIPASGKTSST